MSDAMRTTARDLVAPGKGILAADESTGTIGKRFDQIGVPNTEDARRRYREMLFTTPGLGEHISGVILFDETIRQSTADGVPFGKVLEAAGSIAGIKVDLGAKPLALFPNETVTEGLDGLRGRLAEYHEMGARFAKWRATIIIGDGTPTDFAILANAHAMARYAALCQEADIVPIVEPEILMDGAHDIAACEAATEPDARCPVRAAGGASGGPARLAAEGQHDRAGQGQPGAAQRRRDRRGDDPHAHRARARGDPGRRVPVGWACPTRRRRAGSTR